MNAVTLDDPIGVPPVITAGSARQSVWTGTKPPGAVVSPVQAVSTATGAVVPMAFDPYTGWGTRDGAWAGLCDGPRRPALAAGRRLP